jgi:hypothetical protein
MPKGFHVVCLEPGADKPKEHAPVPAPEPPEGFVDNTVYRYRIDEDGNKVLIGTMEAFPEGWDRPQQFREKGFQKKKEEVKEMPKKDIDFEAIVAKAKQIMTEQDVSLYKASGIVAQETGLHRTTVYNHARAMLQAPSPEPAQVGSQKPVQEAVEPAENSVAPEETKEVTLPPKNDGFGPGDDEPIPYVPVDLRDLIAELREDLDLERKKVAALEKKMELLASALPAGSRTSQENRLAKLLVAVFRELGDAGTA